MKVNRITISADRLNRPLATCFVGKLSSAVFKIGGDIPDDVEGVTVQIGRTQDPTTQQPRENFVAAATQESNLPAARSFRCYLSPFNFPDVSDALSYHVIGIDARGNARWLGTGALVVLDNPADGSPVAPEIVPADTYIRNPATGLYHKLTAAVDEDGNLTVALEDEGIER